MIEKFENRKFEMVVTELLRANRMAREDYEHYFRCRLERMVTEILKIDVLVLIPTENSISVNADSVLITFTIDDMGKLNVNIKGY